MFDKVNKEEAMENEETHLPANLQNDGQKNIFTVPEGYFEALGERIHSSINLAEKLEGLGHPYTVPVGYFDALEERLMQRLAPLPRQEAAVFTLHSGIPVMRWAVAACISFLLIFAGLHFGNELYKNHAYAQAPTEEKLYYRYDVEESLVEDELVDKTDNNAPVTPSPLPAQDKEEL